MISAWSQPGGDAAGLARHKSLKGAFWRVSAKLRGSFRSYPLPLTMSQAQNDFHATTLAHALEQNESIQESVGKSAAELCVVNAVLTQEIPAHLQTGEVAQAIERTEELESRIQNSADELAQVNLALKEEVSLRANLERQLASAKAALNQTQGHLQAKQRPGQGSAAC